MCTDSDDTVEVFLAFDADDAQWAGELSAALIDHGAAVRFSCWSAQADMEDKVYIDLAPPMFYDAAGRPVITAERVIRRAVGVLAALGEHATDSALLAYQLEAAHHRGIAVLGVRVDPDASPPPNLSHTAVIDHDLDAVTGMLHQWRDQAQRRSSLPWLTRLREALAADRDQRR